MDDTCVPYGKWLQAGYPTLGSAHGKPGESSDNGEWRIEAPRFSLGLGHVAGTDVVEETGDHSEQAVVSGEASMGLGNDIAGGGVGLGQDSEGGIQPMESSTPLLLGSLFPINSNLHFSLERMEPVGGLRRSKRVSGRVRHNRQGSSGANLGMFIGSKLDGSL